MPNSKSIWLPEVVYTSSLSLPNLPATAPIPAIEHSRMVKADFLRRKLTKLRKTYFDANQETENKAAGGRGDNFKRKMKPAVMAVERWLMHYALRYSQSSQSSVNSKRDVVFPMFHNMISYDSEKDDIGLEELVADLCVAKDREDDARIIAVELLKLSHSLALDIGKEMAAYTTTKKKGTTSVDKGLVTLVTHKHTMDLIFSSSNKGSEGKKRQLLKINPIHLAKLEAQYKSTLALALDSPSLLSSALSTPTTTPTPTTAADDQTFLDSCFCLLARYQTIQGHGFQAAVSEKAFEVLHKDLGVNLEVFASPLNSTYARHCSAYYDTDACFGSLGSFFDLQVREGSFEANPPFVLAVMDAMATHITALFAAATGPLSFVVVVPVWDTAAFYLSISSSPELRRTIVIPKEEHGFCDGASFQRQDRYRDSPYDTALFILQNKAGHTKYPCNANIEMRIREGFASGIPTEGMRLRQAKEGKGTADECRGVYKGPNKNKTDEGVMKRKRDELKERRGDKKQKRKQQKRAKTSNNKDNNLDR